MLYFRSLNLFMLKSVSFRTLIPTSFLTLHLWQPEFYFLFLYVWLFPLWFYIEVASCIVVFFFLSVSGLFHLPNILQFICGKWQDFSFLWPSTIYGQAHTHTHTRTRKERKWSQSPSRSLCAWLGLSHLVHVVSLRCTLAGRWIKSRGGMESRHRVIGCG